MVPVSCTSKQIKRIFTKSRSKSQVQLDVGLDYFGSAIRVESMKRPSAKSLTQLHVCLISATGITWANLDPVCYQNPVWYDDIPQLPTQPVDLSTECTDPENNPCVLHAAPVLGPTPLGALPQELELTATPNQDIGSYDAVKILVKYFDSVNGWQTLYEHESEDSVTRAVNDGDSFITYGVTGLTPGRQHRFYVTYCRDSDTGTRKCGCRSNVGFLDQDSNGQPDTQPMPFSETPLPTPAAPMEPQYEDNFARPVTTAQDIDMQMNNTGGDGLGPMEVWMSNAAFVDSAGNESFALLPGSSGIDYVPLPNNLHSFNEIEFQPWCRTLIEDPNGIPNPPNNSDCAATPLNYRVDIVNRMVMQSNSCGSGTVAYLYWAQLRYEPDWAADPTTEPTIRVFRTGPPDPNECPPSEIGTELLSSTLVSTLCPAADTSGLKDGSPIIFRIDVGPSVLGGDTPKVVTEIGWDCSNGACAQSCTIGDDLAEQMVDSALSGDNPLRTNLGTMGAFSHHWDTRGNAFRTGSDPPD